MNSNWLDITKEQPKDGERVLVWDNYYGEHEIMTYNEDLKCWDDEYGDEFEVELDAVLPQEPDTLRVKFWMHLPEEPLK